MGFGSCVCVGFNTVLKDFWRAAREWKAHSFSRWKARGCRLWYFLLLLPPFIRSLVHFGRSNLIRGQDSCNVQWGRRCWRCWGLHLSSSSSRSSSSSSTSFFPRPNSEKKRKFLPIHFSSVEMYISLCSQGKFSHLHFKPCALNNGFGSCWADLVFYY